MQSGRQHVNASTVKLCATCKPWSFQHSFCCSALVLPTYNSACRNQSSIPPAQETTTTVTSLNYCCTVSFKANLSSGNSNLCVWCCTQATCNLDLPPDSQPLPSAYVAANSPCRDVSLFDTLAKQQSVLDQPAQETKPPKQV